MINARITNDHAYVDQIFVLCGTAQIQPLIMWGGFGAPRQAQTHPPCWTSPSRPPKIHPNPHRGRNLSHFEHSTLLPLRPAPLRSSPAISGHGDKRIRARGSGPYNCVDWELVACSDEEKSTDSCSVGPRLRPELRRRSRPDVADVAVAAAPLRSRSAVPSVRRQRRADAPVRLPCPLRC